MIRFHTTALLSFVLLVPGAATLEAGNVTGKITYEGAVPKLRPIKMDADPACAAKHSGPVLPDLLVLDANKGMKYIFVQIKNAPASSAATPSTPVEVDQVGCRYEPHVVAVMAGQPLLFRNSDGLLHNVHGLPKENPQFNIGMPPALKEKEVTLNKPELFNVKCDVHPWMKSYVAVMSHPYFAVTGDDGTFEIGNVPAGTYTIEAWHERLGTQTAEVTVGASGSVTADFTFKAPSKK
jgi:plastocyanin